MSCTTFIKEQPENERWSLDGQKNIFDWIQQWFGTEYLLLEKELSKPEPVSPIGSGIFKINFKKTSN
jgi:hypothetical protein